MVETRSDERKELRTYALTHGTDWLYTSHGITACPHQQRPTEVTVVYWYASTTVKLASTSMIALVRYTHHGECSPSHPSCASALKDARGEASFSPAPSLGGREKKDGLELPSDREACPFPWPWPCPSPCPLSSTCRAQEAQPRRNSQDAGKVHARRM